MSRPAVTCTDAAPPFEPAWLETVFLVPHPPATWPFRFAIVTAHNPGGRRQGEDANRAGQRELDELVRREGLDCFRVIGASPDLSHREEGYALVLDDLATAAGIAARFGQAGFFWVEEQMVFVCTDASGRGWPVAPWSERLVAGEGTNFEKG